jgi:hypothetical protein
MTLCPDCQVVNAVGSLFCLACSKPLGLSMPVAPISGAQASPPTPAAGPPVAYLPTPLAPAAPGPISTPPGACATRCLRLIALENLLPTGLALKLPDTGYTGTLLVGRNDLANGTVVDLDLGDHGAQDRLVSRRHARLRYAEGLVYLADWESAHGTWLNKRRLGASEEGLLCAGDEIRFAQFVFHVELR